MMVHWLVMTQVENWVLKSVVLTVVILAELWELMMESQTADWMVLLKAEQMEKNSVDLMAYWWVVNSGEKMADLWVASLENLSVDRLVDQMVVLKVVKLDWVTL
jgi:hypothetical protein